MLQLTIETSICFGSWLYEDHSVSLCADILCSCNRIHRDSKRLFSASSKYKKQTFECFMLFLRMTVRSEVRSSLEASARVHKKLLTGDLEELVCSQLDPKKGESPSV